MKLPLPRKRSNLASLETLRFEQQVPVIFGLFVASCCCRCCCFVKAPLFVYEFACVSLCVCTCTCVLDARDGACAPMCDLLRNAVTRSSSERSSSERSSATWGLLFGGLKKQEIFLVSGQNRRARRAAGAAARSASTATHGDLSLFPRRRVLHQGFEATVWLVKVYSLSVHTVRN